MFNSFKVRFRQYKICKLLILHPYESKKKNTSILFKPTINYILTKKILYNQTILQ